MRVITMTVVPRSSRESIEEVGENSFVVQVKSTPERGRDTKDALKVLARHLSVPFAKLMLATHDSLQAKTVVVMD